MFAQEATFNASPRSKQSPSLISWLCFNAKQSAHYDVGFFGERVAMALFQDAGFNARKPSYHGTDLEVRDPKTAEFITVEVKTARMSESRKNWQFCLNKPKNCSTSHSAYILLICIAQTGIFTYLIPSEFLAGISQFVITSHPEKYRGKVAPFRNRGPLSFQAACNVMELMRLQ